MLCEKTKTPSKRPRALIQREHLTLVRRLRDLRMNEVEVGMRVRLLDGIPAHVAHVGNGAAILSVWVPFTGQAVSGKHVVAHYFNPPNPRARTHPDVLVEWDNDWPTHQGTG